MPYPNYSNYPNYVNQNFNGQLYPGQYPMAVPYSNVVSTPPQITSQTTMQSQLQQQNQPSMTIQNGGFISVRSIEEARNYPVAPGNSITFKDETAPYVYTKTMGFSPLDRPVFEIFKLVKENAADSPANAQSQAATELMSTSIKYALASDCDALKDKIDGILEDIKMLRDQVKRVSAVKVKKDDKEEKEDRGSDN